MNKIPEQLHLNVQLDDSIRLDKFINCNSTKDFLKILRRSQGFSLRYLMQESYVAPPHTSTEE